MDLQDKVALGAAMFGTPSVNTGASTMLAEVVSDAKDGEVAVWMRDEEGNEQKVEIPCDGDLREGDVATVIVQDGRATAISAGGAGERSKAETEAAQQAATDAQTTAETAQTDATQAKTDAADAKETAAGAETAAGEAKDAAADATKAAGDAQSAADTAKSAADAATSAAADASTKADAASSAAADAGTKADAASTKADAASSAATEAGNKADAAQTTANTAQQAATDAQTDATNAAKAASDATDAATKAQTDATNAAKVANDATDAATAAKTTAETAQTTAQTASDTATAAKEEAMTTKQHFWADDEGAHVATTAHEEGAAITGSNLLATSEGVQIRDGETALSKFAADTISINSGRFSIKSTTTEKNGITYHKTDLLAQTADVRSDDEYPSVGLRLDFTDNLCPEVLTAERVDDYNYKMQIGGDTSGQIDVLGDTISITATNCTDAPNLTIAGENAALLAYPVGSIYMSVNSTSPADLFGGTWEEIAGGRVLMGQSSAYAAGTTGGSATHTHTGPAHTHTYGIGYGMHYGAVVNYLNTGQLKIYNKGTWTNTASKTDSTAVTFATPVAAATGRTSKTITRTLATAETSSAGTGNTGSASSLPPYLAVYMWKRTA